MPSATSTKTAKPAMATGKSGAGSKRKEYPVREKSTTDRDSKKARTGKEEKPLKSALKKESKSKSKPAKAVVDASSDEDSDGGVPLEDSDSEDAVGPADGLHPDRLKAVVANSKLYLDSRLTNF